MLHYIAAMELILNKVVADNDVLQHPCYVSDVPDSILRDYLNQVKEVVDKGVHLKYIHPKDKSYLVAEKPKCGRLYGLVKDHAPKEKWLFEERVPPLRPVVSMSGTTTEGLAHWLDQLAKPLVPKLPSFIEDTRHMLEFINETNQDGPQPDGAIPVVMDINDMYGSIPWEEGLVAFEEAINDLDGEIPIDFIMEVVKIVLACNVFEFNGVRYMQRFGASMGLVFAPPFACIFMGWLEMKMLGSYMGVLPKLWKRYIDDIFMLWHGTKQELIQFISFLNSFHPTIKFKCIEGEHFNFETRSVDFLDTTIFIDDDGFIQTTLYSKPNKKIQYLLPSSCHPGHISKNIPYSLAYRLRRIESVPINFENNLKVLRSNLITRGYKQRSIDDAFSRVNALDRSATLAKAKKNTTSPVVLSLKYHPGLPSISPIFQKHYQVLIQEPYLKEVFPVPPIVSFRRPKNLRDILIRAKLPTKKVHETRKLRPGFKHCGKRVDCCVCPRSTETAVHKSTSSGITYPITSHVTCRDAFVIYSITCAKNEGPCKSFPLQYVGSSSRPANVRFQEHLGSVVYECHQTTRCTIGEHFRSPGHGQHNMKFLIIEKVFPHDRHVLEARERFWRRKYDAIHNGLNRQAT
jgi:peptide-methionine (R)-S-oxide reductase